MEIYLVALIILVGLGISGIITGVSNDAVNFLNSAIGSRVAPRYVAMIIASLGMLAGVTFSTGMMEVARKGIFHPQFFTMPELIPMFVGVMLANILLLDLYNTFGLPTSTTVAIVFGLLGGSVGLSYIKAHHAAGDYGSLLKYINTGNSLAIVSGILISVAIAFVFGAIIQFFSRLLFTFDYHQRLKRYGAIWGGLALSFITYFIIIKGANGFTFITPESLSWIQTHTGLILLISFLVYAFILELILLFTKVNILKPIILIGTFALAMAFSANDLVNFIGVPLAGWNAYRAAEASSSPLTVTMGALQEGIPASTFILLAAGVIMALTLWFSRKARTVTETEINLSRQDEGYERFGSSLLARTVVRMASSLGEGIKKMIPWPLKIKLDKRLDPTKDETASIALADSDAPAFDLVRAAVNLMVSSALISFGTSLKLPLSTTYVTFMVAMGTSFSDRAWDRDSAVYRVTGVLTVIGGWFLTALMVFTVSLVFTFAIYYSGAPAVLIILGLGLFVIIRNHHLHKKRKKAVEDVEIFNLKKVKDDKYAIETTFEHAGIFLQAVAINLGVCYEGLSTQNRRLLKSVKGEINKIQSWANIIVANIFKTLRLLEQEEVATTHKYAQSVNVLQELAECHRDIISRAYEHIDNHHKPLLPVQLEELKQVKDCILNLLEKTSDALMNKEIPDFEALNRDKQKLHRLITELNNNQVQRIQDNTSKTRLSILFYGFARDSKIIAEQLSNLLKIFQESFPLNESLPLNKELPPENSE